MAVINFDDGIKYHLDDTLKSNLDKAKSAIKKDWDMVFVVDGVEGSGKSVIAQQMARYCDPSLDISRITFSNAELKEVILKAEPYQAVIYDEAYGGASSRGTMSTLNKMLIKFMTEIRQKNLFVFVVLPTFFDLDRYIALWRSRALIHVYSKDFERGTFCFFSRKKKKDLYILGKKFYSYAKPRANFIGRFVSGYAVDEAAYRKKKYKMLSEENAPEEDLSPRAQRFSERFNALVHGLFVLKGVSLKEMVESMNPYLKNPMQYNSFVRLHGEFSRRIAKANDTRNEYNLYHPEKDEPPEKK